MSDTAEGWGMVADLLAANADRFPDVDFAEVIGVCRAEVDRLDREGARDTFVEELAERMLNDHEGVGSAWKYAAEQWRDTWRNTAHSAIERLQPFAEWLIAEKAWKVSLALPTELPGLGRVKDDEWCQHPDCRDTNWQGRNRKHLRSPACPPAEKPAPRSWPSLDKVPIVKTVANENGAQAMHHFMEGWRWRLTGGVVRAEDRAGTWTEVSA